MQLLVGGSRGDLTREVANFSSGVVLQDILPTDGPAHPAIFLI
jgi:hypothetical protein